MNGYHDSPFGASSHPSPYHPDMPFQRHAQQQQQSSPYAHFPQQQERAYGRQPQPQPQLYQQAPQPSMHQSVYPDSRLHGSDEGRAHLDRLFSGLVSAGSVPGHATATLARQEQAAYSHEYGYEHPTSRRHMPYSPTDAHAQAQAHHDQARAQARDEHRPYYHSTQALSIGTAHGFECLPAPTGYAVHAQYAAAQDEWAHHQHRAGFAPQAHAWNAPTPAPSAGRGDMHYSHHSVGQAQHQHPVLPPFQHVNNAVWQASILPPMQLALPPPVPYQTGYESEATAAWDSHAHSGGAYEKDADYQEAGQAADGMTPSFYSDDGHPRYNEVAHHQHAQAVAQADAHNYAQAEALPRLANDALVQSQQRLQQQQQQQAPAEEPQVIDAGASAIPPPPAIEDSAHPLAALATDLVWEAFLAAANCTSPVFGSYSHFPSSSDRWNTAKHEESSSSSPTSFPSLAHQSRSPIVHTSDRSRSASAAPEGGFGSGSGNGFGAIGGERRPRYVATSGRANVSGPHGLRSPTSDTSSPASSNPGTPHSDAPVPGSTWGVSSSEMSSGRLSGGGNYWNQQVLSPALSKRVVTQPQRSSRASPPHHQIGHGQAPFTLAPPHALFEQVQKLLGATLLSQQVLLLALYFIAKLPQTSPLYPPATSQSALQSTSAPFKLLLAALVVANKHLDDNSFRNSTFAAVSGITLPEVNALEYSLLAGLSFDINLHTDTWLAWLQDLENQGTTRFTRERVQVGSIIAPLIRKVVQERHAFEVKQQEQQQLQYGDRDGEDQQDHHPLSYSTSTIASVDMPMPMTPISPPPRSESSWSSVFDMDAAVPIEQRPKYKKAFSHQPEAAASGLSSSWNQTGCAAFPSHSSASVGAANAPTSAHKVGREAYGAEYRRCSDWPPPTHYGYSGPSGRNNLVAA